MKIADLGKSRILNLLLKAAGTMMGSRARQWCSDTAKTLGSDDILPGETVLGVGCGTGFPTIPPARLLGDQGCLIAMDPSSGFGEEVSKRVRIAGLENIRIVIRGRHENRYR
jgi:ubiquinone/menaquinone biosynthesis C-methylase UbiE